jgi:hypothetical protein
MKQTAAKRRLRRHRTTRRHNKRQYEGGGIGPVHAVGIALEAHHVQHSFFAMLSMATQNKNLNVVSGIVSGLGAVGASASVVATGGLAIVGLGILIFTAMAIRESIHSQEKLHRTITELIRVLRKIQKTMMLCIAISNQYRIEINTRDLQACLSKIYASLDEFLTDDARILVKTYAQNYEKESANVNAQVDIVVDFGTQIQKPNRVSIFFSKIGKSISGSYRRWFKSDAKEKELRELMNELTPFLVLLLSQSVLQFMVCQTSMLTDGESSDKLKIGNDAVKQSCQYKDFQLSALLDSIMRITADLDREPANRASHIKALNIEVTRVTNIVKTNPNYDSFTGLKAKLDKLSTIDGTNYYDKLRAELTDLNKYDEAAFLTECNDGQTQTLSSVSDINSTLSETSDKKSTLSESPKSSADRPSQSPQQNRGPSSDRLLDHRDIDSVSVGHESINVGFGDEDDDHVGSVGSAASQPQRNWSNSSRSSTGSAFSVLPDPVTP